MKKLFLLLSLCALVSTLFAAMPAEAIALPAPKNGVAAVVVINFYRGDGPTGSITFNAYDSSGNLVGQPARGAVLLTAAGTLPTSAQILAAVDAVL